MYLDRNGNILFEFNLREGVIVKDGDFTFCLPYERREDVERGKEIWAHKKKLNDNDFQLLKLIDKFLVAFEDEKAKTGVTVETLLNAYTVVEDRVENYVAWLKDRENSRSEVNRLESELQIPTITEEEMKAAEEKAMKTLKTTGGWIRV